MRKILSLFAIFIILTLWFLSRSPEEPANIKYGVSFSRFHADELELDWKETYLAILNDLRVKNFRFSAHWPLIEPEAGKYNFEELDFQMEEAKKTAASVILTVGRRLPGWPECHEPEWLKNQVLNIKDQNDPFDKTQGHPEQSRMDDISKFKNERTLKYMEAVVSRYKDYDNIKYWQVENEPFLTFFSRKACGKFDEEFFKKEIELVRQLDPSRPILITDSGEFGLWYKAYGYGDVFGTSLYLYIWNRRIGPFRYPITPAFFRIKQNLTRLFFGKKPIMLIELSAEPWLLKPIVDTPIDIQLDRMGIDKFNEMISFAKKSGFETQYLWGAEWWYWLKLQGYENHWLRAKELFGDSL